MTDSDTTPVPGGEQEGKGSLDKLQRELYAREESPNLKARSQDVQQLGVTRKRLPRPQADGATTSVTYKDVRAKRLARRRRILIILGVVVGVVTLLVAGTVGALWYRSRQTVTNAQIVVEVAGPSDAQAGDSVAYTVAYRNDSFVDWQDVQLAVTTPEGFALRSATPEVATSGREHVLGIEGLPAGQSGELMIEGRLVGEQGAAAIVEAELTITPVNFPSGRFSMSSLFTTTISSVPLALAVEVAEDAAPGERVLATLTITNVSPDPIEAGYVKLSPAPGMELASDDPEFSAGFDQLSQEWMLPSLAPLESVTRRAVVFLSGQPGEQRVLDVAIGIVEGDDRFVQQTSSAVIALSSTELTLVQAYNNTTGPLTVFAQDAITGDIRFTNTGTTALTDIVVKSVISGTGFDPASLRLTGGAYDPATQTITWTPASVPALSLLQPNTEQALSYQFRVLPTEDFPADESARNSAIVITTTVDSLDVDVPTGSDNRAVSDRAVLSVASELTLFADAFYDDGRLGIKSEGPLPPRVGEETTYTVRLRAGSTHNDVGNVRIIATLPDGVRYTGQTISPTGEIDFNERTGELTWRLPLIAGLTGRTSPPAELQFQVAVRPGENQRRSVIAFLNKLEASGDDQFTDSQLVRSVTAFPTTETAVDGQGRVE